MTWSECLPLLTARLPGISWPAECPDEDLRTLPEDGERGVELALARWALTDARAAAEVLLRLETVMRAWMTRTGYPSALQDDALQDASLALLGPEQKLRKFTGAGALHGFLAVFATRRALNLRRAEPREGLLAQSYDILMSSTPELKLLRAELTGQLKVVLARALETVTPEQRTLLTFRYHDDLGVHELAQVLELHRVTASRLLGEARDALRAAVHAELESRALGLPEEVWRWLGSRTDLSLPRLFSVAQGSTSEMQPVPR